MASLGLLSPPQVQDVLSSLDGEELELLKKELIEIKEIFEAREDEKDETDETENETQEAGSGPGGNGELYSQIRSFSTLCESRVPIEAIGFISEPQLNHESND